MQWIGQGELPRMQTMYIGHGQAGELPRVAAAKINHRGKNNGADSIQIKDLGPATTDFKDWRLIQILFVMALFLNRYKNGRTDSSSSHPFPVFVIPPNLCLSAATSTFAQFWSG
jgi:hypothetical protein